MNAPAALTLGGPVDQLVRRVAEHVELVASLDLRAAVELATAAVEAAEATALAAYRRIEEDAERAQRALEGLACKAHERAGELLRKIPTTGPGRGKKSPRMEAARAAGIDDRYARRLVELVEIEPEVRHAVQARLEREGKRITVRAIVAGASAHRSSGTDNWYTPGDILDAMREVFDGPPDDDPASCLVGQQLVGADRWWSATVPELGEAELAAGLTQASVAEQLACWAGVGSIYRADTGEVIDGDGLTPKQFARRANTGRISHAGELRGKVWLNPPYAFPSPFCRAVLEGYLGVELDRLWQLYAADAGRTVEDLDADPDQGQVWRAAAVRDRSRAVFAATLERERGGVGGPEGTITEAIVLVNVGTDTEIQQLMLAAGTACFVAGRLAFRDAHGEPQDSNNSGQVIFYFGPNLDAFRREFGRFGVIKL